MLLSAIVVTGGAVRLSGSGLGCTDWPNCNDERIIDVSSGHAAVENINRLFTFLVGFGVLLAAVAAWYRRPRRRDLIVYGMVMLVGVPAQGLVGAVVVWTDLHPAAVQWHFLLSMILVSAAVMMIVRAGEPDGVRRLPIVVPRVRRRVRLLAVWTALTVVIGTIVTNTGPHAGDEEAQRFWGSAADINGEALRWVSRIHGVVVWITVAVAFSLLWTLRTLRRDRGVLDAPLTAWLIMAIVQGSVGYVQYSAGLPVGLVAVHLAGATALVGITTWLWAATSTTAERAGEMIERVARRSRRARSGSSLPS